MALQFLIIVLGFVLLIKGADWLVKGASKLAGKYQISDLSIGLTIVAFGTSAPELVVNVIASFQGHQGIVFVSGHVYRAKEKARPLGGFYFSRCLFRLHHLPDFMIRKSDVVV